MEASPVRVVELTRVVLETQIVEMDRGNDFAFGGVETEGNKSETEMDAIGGDLRSVSVEAFFKIAYHLK